MNEPKPKHHPFGPSSLRLRQLCPASYQVEQGLADVENEYSRKGSDLHALIAKALNTTGKLTVYSEEEHAVLTKCIKYINKTLGDSIFEHTEKELKYIAENGEILFYGTSDVVAKAEDGTLVIIDWKTGRGRVPLVKDNLQMKAYALAAMQEYGEEKVKACIYNPTINQRSSFTFKNKAKLEEEILAIIAACKEEDPEIVPGFEQCRFCLGSVHDKCIEGIKQSVFAAMRERRRQEQREEEALEGRDDDGGFFKFRWFNSKPKGTRRKKKEESSVMGCGCLILIVISLILGAIEGCK